MERALELAQRGKGKVNPNPMVGAVIVRNGKIIGEGWHEYFGGVHGEINAIQNVHGDVEGADLYVTLEPCSHFGKTPPCIETIIKHKIHKVIIGMKDPNPLVCGKGIIALKQAGIEVESGILEKECKKSNEIFIKYITKKEPFVVMKSAVTLDGKIASYTGDSKWITDEKSRFAVHKIRNDVMAVMVGVGTVISDNPFLTARVENGKDPIRIVVDSTLRIPENSHVLELDKNQRCIIATSNEADKEKKQRLQNRGIEIIETPTIEKKVDLKYLMKQIGKMGIDSILLEGGGELNFSAVQEKIVDKFIYFIAPKLIGGRTAKTSLEGNGFRQMKEAVSLKDIEIYKLQNDVLITAYPQ